MTVPAGRLQSAGRLALWSQIDVSGAASDVVGAGVVRDGRSGLISL